MKRLIQLTIIQFLICSLPVTAQNIPDSLIRFSDLRYHSDFEKEAILNFVKYQKDTFNLFLSIDEKINTEEAKGSYETYLSIFNELVQQKIAEKNIARKIKISYSTVHSRFLQKYNDNEYFPVMFRSGTFNCVSASMLYAMVFDRLAIPYKVMVSSNHVYLIGNPGAKSIVIETTNPSFEKAIFNGEFQQQYVDYLRSSKLISETEYRNKSVEEIFEEKFNQVREATFNNLPGIQYYNKALTKLQNNDFESALTLSQKAYFFYPDNQVKNLLNTSLMYYIEKCNFEKVSDIDYLALFSRFENTDENAVIGIFNNIVVHHLQYTNKEAFCDSLYQRLISQLTDKKTIEEISFTYNMQMSYRYQNTDKIEKYVVKALEIKGNHLDANVMMENFLQRKLFSTTNSYSRLDTIIQLEQKYNLEMVKPLLMEQKLIAYLQIATELIEQKKITTADKYLLDFESSCKLPITDKLLSVLVENTYRVASNYYLLKGNKTTAKTYVARGLKFVPNSKILEAAVN